VVAAVAILVAVPHRELDWEGTIIPMAQKYSGNQSKDKPLRGINVVVSGATSGIGLGLTRALSKLGATVIALGRSPQKLAALKEEIPSVHPVEADMKDMRAVAQATDEIQQSFDKIDVLINNAGMHDGFTNLMGKSKTVDGYDTVFQVNYLSSYLITEKLSDILANSTKPTIVQISSSYHWAVDGSDLMPGEEGLPLASRPGGSIGFFVFRSQRSYSNSKLAQILHSRALKQKHPALSKARIVNVCPAWVATHIAGSSGSFAKFALQSGGYPSDGWGLSSAFEAMFATDDGEADFYSNTRAFDLFPYILSDLAPWTYRTGLRDFVALAFAMSALAFQRLVPHAFPAKSSPQSYNETLRDALYDWSHAAVGEYL